MEYKLQFLRLSPNNNFILLIKYLNTTNMLLMKTLNKVFTLPATERPRL